MPWRERAACRGQAPTMRANNSGPAKRICRACPVAEACLFVTLAAELAHRGDRFYTAGGMTAREREQFQTYLDGLGLDVHQLAADERRHLERAAA